MLIGPTGERPTVYASGSELNWGVRIVAGYGDRLLLFSVPPDIFNDSRITPEGSNQLWTEELEIDEPRIGGIWPVRIHGAEFGRVERLVDIAIDSGPGMAVWAFSDLGKVYVFEIDVGDPRQMRVRKKTVLREGDVVDLEDGDGDYIMRDAPPLPSFRRSEGDELQRRSQSQASGPAQDGAGDSEWPSPHPSPPSSPPTPTPDQYSRSMLGLARTSASRCEVCTSPSGHTHMHSPMGSNEIESTLETTLETSQLERHQVERSLRVEHQQHTQTAFGWVSEFDEAVWIQERTEYGVFAGDCVTRIECELA